MPRLTSGDLNKPAAAAGVPGGGGQLDWLKDVNETAKTLNELVKNIMSAGTGRPLQPPQVSEVRGSPPAALPPGPSNTADTLNKIAMFLKISGYGENTLAQLLTAFKDYKLNDILARFKNVKL